MIFDELNEDNFTFFAIQNYNNPHASTKDDFTEDLKRFRYVQRHLKKYDECGEIKVHLLINHIIVLYNVFGEAATPMLFFKLESEMWPQLKTFMVFLNKIPDYPKTNIHDIPVDLNCLRELNLIFKDE